MFKRRKNIDQVTIDDITKSLLTQLYNSSQFYKEQHTYHLNYKIKNKFRWRIIIKCKFDNSIIKLMSEVQDYFINTKKANSTRIAIDINPNNML